ncbi:uncharacterized protein LOC112554100 [Pomacea canaliculata]|uniref:uncharacterized protein LOC112554100 n=1 Tax=Pomacea canaliculata TaxID=400727 RepID=UPI000D738650|nr:uncharacterized protein LOC112554100 [Pomacea canaliculata]
MAELIKYILKYFPLPLLLNYLPCEYIFCNHHYFKDNFTSRPPLFRDMASSYYWDEKIEARWLKKQIEEIIKALNIHHKNVNISRVTGSSVAIATGGTAAGLAIAAPFTLGVTLIAAIVLGIVSGVSGAVSVGASVTGHFIKKHNVKEVQKKWEKFRLKFLERHNVKDITDMNARESGDAVEGVGAVGGVARTAGGVTSAIVRGVKAAGTAAKVASPILTAVSFVALPLDFIDLISAAHSLDKAKPSPASKSLQDIVGFLDRVINGEFDD